MSVKEQRNDLIKKISSKRQSNLICYVAGDRQNVSTRIAPDIIPIFHEHLKKMDDEKIDLLLFTKGGDVLTALRLVELIYEYTDNFSVIIPYKSYSAGTLICLGASEILMTRMAELSPVDPNVNSMFNPQDPNNPNARLSISVEDVYSFIAIVKDIVGIKDDQSLGHVFSRLLDNVHPLALGSIHRTYSLIRSVSKKLLMLHMKPSQELKINHIIDNLTEKLFSHSYMITRREAKELLNLPVTYTNNDIENDIWSLYKLYEDYLQIEKPFIPEIMADINGRFSVTCGIIESLPRVDEYNFDGIIQKIDINNPSSISVNIIEQGWKLIYE